MKNNFDEIIKEIEETNDALLNTKSAEEQLKEIKKSIEFHFYNIEVTENVLISVQEVVNIAMIFESKFKRLYMDIQVYLNYDIKKLKSKNIEYELSEILDKYDLKKIK